MFQEKILAYKLRVNEETGEVYHGYFEEIENTLEAKQKYVGGYIEVFRLTDEIDIILNDEGKINGMKPNRALFDNKKVLDYFVGNILCVRHNEEGDFTSILEDDENIILRYLKPIMEVDNVYILMPEFVCSYYKNKKE